MKTNAWRGLFWTESSRWAYSGTAASAARISPCCAMEMPSMLLEMGFINNEEDNRLFDENLQAYAQAIAQGRRGGAGNGKTAGCGPHW